MATTNGNDHEALARRVADRVENYYGAHRLCCSEAMLLVFNRTFGGGLSDEEAVRMSAGFCGGMGDGEGVCGALAGAVAALGLLLGRGKTMRAMAARLRAEFQASEGSTLCRDLTRPLRDNRLGKRAHCGRLTGRAAELAARLLLGARPDLAAAANRDFLEQRDTRAGVLAKKLARVLRPDR